MRIDPHSHSTASDGTESPAEVMRAAARVGLDVIGLSDHDTTQGWGEATAEAAALGLGFIPGVEVSCRHDGKSIHLLALWPSGEDPEFLAMLERTRDSRVERARQIVDLLAQDYELDWDAVISKAPNAETIGRPHIADALVDIGVIADRDAAFIALLGTDSPYYLPHYAPEIADAIAIVRGAGGVPVLAHPGADDRTVTSDDLIVELASQGLVGLEIDHREHSEAQKARLAALASRLSLIRTGASDYHGAGKQNRLGENLTSPEAYEALQEARG
ncbi:MAG: PHP domain-containing protein [Demequinaceae bacterium]|nr:PHP domain-containing protein [Demequinaceae bacterium]